MLVRFWNSWQFKTHSRLTDLRSFMLSGWMHLILLELSSLRNKIRCWFISIVAFRNCELTIVAGRWVPWTHFSADFQSCSRREPCGEEQRKFYNFLDHRDSSVRWADLEKLTGKSETWDRWRRPRPQTWCRCCSYRWKKKKYKVNLKNDGWPEKVLSETGKLSGDHFSKGRLPFYSHPPEFSVSFERPRGDLFQVVLL